MMDFDHPVNRVPAWATKEGLAQTFTRRCSHEWRFCPKKKWVRWTGSRWEPDQVSHVMHLIRLICREAGEQVSRYSTKVRLGSWRCMASVERLARKDPMHAFNPEDCARCSRLPFCPVGRKNGRLARLDSAESRRRTSAC